MAHFRAVIQGARGEASRLGHKATGISARVQTWGYDVVVDVRHCDEKTAARDKTLEAGDWATIELVPHGSTSEGKLIARVNLTSGQII